MASAPLGWELYRDSSWEVRTWEPCLSMLAWFCHLCLFLLPPCSSPLLSLCPPGSPSSLPYLLHPLPGA